MKCLIVNDHILKDADLAEEVDPAKLTDRKSDTWKNYVFLPGIAQTYGLEFCDLRSDWKRYLRMLKSGYLVVASRAENKVCFIDLQPLYQYYREMSLTTQAKYNQTQNTAPSDDQWPYGFNHVATQKPVVAATLTIEKPTAVACGYPHFRAGWEWEGDETYKNRCFIARMDGTLLVYDVDGLNTEAAATTPVLERSVKIGRNTTCIFTGGNSTPHDQPWVVCREDREIYRLHPDGTVINKLRDSRIQDPVWVNQAGGPGRGAFRRLIIEEKWHVLISIAT